MSKQIGILRFLGTNCDRDLWQAVAAMGHEPKWLWYTERFEPSEFGAFMLPGGFSYGDYLRCGALAAKAPVMDSLRQAARDGYPVLGICNGFQILCEAGLLPGVLVRNERRKFVDRWVELRIEGVNAWAGGDPGGRLRVPIAHGEGRFYVDSQELAGLKSRGQIWCVYAGDNPNGSVGAVAGICNEAGNVCGLMPHPERAMFDWMGGEDGRRILAQGLRGRS